MLTLIHFYPRSPCGERRPVSFFNTQFSQISIHALLAESDGNSVDPCRNPTHISIHALLAESDDIT